MEVLGNLWVDFFSARFVLIAASVLLAAVAFGLILHLVKRYISSRFPQPQSVHAPSIFETKIDVDAPRAPNIPRSTVEFIARRDRQGRDVVRFLKRRLSPDKNQSIVLWGAGGIGKTTIAVECARALRRAYKERIVWASADGHLDFTFSTLLDEIAIQLGRPDLLKNSLNLKRSEIQALISLRPALIVLDGFESISMEEQTQCARFLFSESRCSSLITSRTPLHGAQNISIDGMSHTEALAFVNNLISESENPSAFADLPREDVAKAANNNPLIMKWVVAQVAHASEPKQLAARLLSDAGPPTEAERIFNQSFEHEIGNDSRAALLGLSMFVPSASRLALAQVSGLKRERLAKALRRLSSFGFIDATSGSRVTLTGLTREMARSRLFDEPGFEEYQKRFVAWFRAYAERRSEVSTQNVLTLERDKDNLLAAIDLASEISDWNSVIKIYAALEQFLFLRGYWQDAIKRGEQAISAANASDDALSSARFSLNVALIRSYRGEYEKAKEANLSVLAVSERLGNQDIVASALHNLGTIAGAQGAWSEARGFYEQSLEIRRKLGNQSGIASGLLQLGAIALHEADFNKARELYAQSLEVRKLLGDQGGTAAGLHQLGLLAQAEGDWQGARHYFEESLSIERQLGYLPDTADTLLQLGILNKKEKKAEEARSLFNEALEIRERLGDRLGSAVVLRQIGLLHHDLGNSQLALESLIRAYSFFKEVGASQNVDQIIEDITSVRQNSEDSQFDQVAKHLVETEPQMADKINAIRVDYNYLDAQELMHQGHWRTAREILEAAKQTYKELNDHLGFAKTLLALAQIEQSIGDLEKARWTYKDALDQFQDLDERYEAITCVYLGRLELQTNFVDEGLSHLRRGERYFQKVDDAENLIKVRQLLESAEQLAG